ncbi:MAG: LysR family transcriptional regulator [Eubacteriales bacterium]|nr:LysR family transcriptional regulator [Eubacteriales bacterium]
MDLKEFTYLVALAEEGSISKAADRLYMAQSSLSQFLQNFESELGTKLFVRTSKGIHPTYGGECFIEQIRQILIQYQRAKNELWDNENMEAGRVVFGISSFRGIRMLPKILKSFYEKYPKVKVDVVEEHSMRLEELLIEGKLDLAVVAMPTVKLKDGIEFLKDDEVLLVANKDHPVMQYVHPIEGTSNYWVDIEDAAKFEFIMSDYNTILGSLSRKLFREKGIKYHAENNNITAAMLVPMAREGLGLAFTYQSCAEAYENVRYLRIGRRGVFLELGLAYPPNEYHAKAAEELEKVIREIYRKDQMPGQKC